MCVAPWAIHHPKYFEWYRRRREQGDFVFLDNGAYEGELVAGEELVRLCRELQPNVVAIPDKINDENESSKLARDFVTQYALPPEIELMRTLQSADRTEEKWVEIFKQQTRMYRWVAFPRALGPLRANLIDACLAHRVTRNKIHAFGWIGSLKEIARLARLGVASMDSAGPVWRGLLGWHVESEVTWSDVPFDPTSRDGFPGDLNEELAEENVNAVLSACVNL